LAFEGSIWPQTSSDINAGQQADGETIRLRNGRTATGRTGPPLGSLESPISIDRLEMKFADCARNVVRPLSDDLVRAAAHAILHLEDGGDVSELVRNFS
jgi:hypothetical protein